MIKVINNGGKIADTVKLIGTGTLTLGKGSSIRDYTVIEMSNGKMELGEKSVIGYNSFIQCTGNLTIGKGSLLGPHVCYITSNHSYEGELIKQPLIRGSILIGNNVWIGANVTIAHNIRINNNTVVGANSFVNKSIPFHEVWGGVPAKYLKRK
jgi:acetyltransferase-like isoleucine patch superfamily enzyme